MTVEARGTGQLVEPDLCFTKADLRDVVPHEDDPVVISIVTVERRVPGFSLIRGAPPT